MKKDYWSVCGNACKVMAFLAILVVLILIFSIGFSVPTIVVLIFAILWIVLSYMFSIRYSKTIPFFYTFLGIGFILNIAQNILNPSSLNLSSILVYLIYIYLIECTYKAQKQGIIQNNKNISVPPPQTNI
ncbi:MAG: hypothetical protein WCV55_02290 [Candidatus Paceibacterota bacterium]